MGKRLTTDQSFDCYQKVKAVSRLEEAGNLYQFVENFFLDIHDYDLWEEGQEGVPYQYPWGTKNTGYLKNYGITRKGTRIFFRGKEVTLRYPYFYLDGEKAGEYTD